MTNVIPIRRPEPVPIVERSIRRQTVTELFNLGTLPEVGDFVFLIAFAADDGQDSVLVTVPGSGRIRKTHHDADSIQIHFDLGLIVTVSGATTLAWYPDPSKEQ